MKEVDGAKVKLKRKNNSVKVFKFQDKCNSIRRYAILRLHNTRSYCILYSGDGGGDNHNHSPLDHIATKTG